MDDTETEDTHIEELNTETQMDATSGRESPIIAQTQKTIDRERQRTKSCSKRGRGRAANRGHNPSSSRSVSPERQCGRAGRSWTVSAASNTTSSRNRSRSPPLPPQTPVANRERGRAGRNAATDAATNAINASRENRARSPTRSRSRSPGENPGTPTGPGRGTSADPSSTPKRGRKKTSVIWNHMSQKMVNKVVVTFCNHCPLNWVLSGSTSTALQLLRQIHCDKITEAEENQLNSVSEPSTPIRRGRKKSSMIWNHCTEKIVDGIKYTCCKHCSSQWNLNGSTSTALQHIRLVHTDLI